MFADQGQIEILELRFIDDLLVYEIGEYLKNKNAPVGAFFVCVNNRDHVQNHKKYLYTDAHLNYLVCRLIDNGK